MINITYCDLKFPHCEIANRFLIAEEGVNFQRCHLIPFIFMYFKFHDLESKTDLRAHFSFQQRMEGHFLMLYRTYPDLTLKIAKWLTFYFISRVREGQFLTFKFGPIYKVKTGQNAYVKYQHRRRAHFSTLKIDPIFFIYITFLDLAVLKSKIAHILFQQRNKGGGAWRQLSTLKIDPLLHLLK